MAMTGTINTGACAAGNKTASIASGTHIATKGAPE